MATPVVSAKEVGLDKNDHAKLSMDGARKPTPFYNDSENSDYGKDGASTPTAAAAAAEHEHTKRELARVSYELDVAKVDKSKLEQEVSTLRDKESDQELRINALERELELAKKEPKVNANQKEQELALRRAESEKRSWENQLERMRQQKTKFEEEARNLRCEVATSDDKLRSLEDELQKERERGKKAESWYKQYSQRHRENFNLQKTIEEQKNTIWHLEMASKQESATAKIASPGDFFKMMKANEPMNIQQQNAELKRELEKMRADLDAVLSQMPQRTESSFSRPFEAPMEGPVPWTSRTTGFSSCDTLGQPRW